MYVSKKKIRETAALIQESPGKFYRVVLDIGTCDEREIETVSKIMFDAWTAVATGNWIYHSKKYLGMMKEFRIDCDKETGMCRPYFTVVAVARPAEKSDSEKELYKHWWSVWISALNYENLENIHVKFDSPEKSQAEEVLTEFFRRDDSEKRLVKTACSKSLYHRLTRSGIFLGVTLSRLRVKNKE